MISPVEAQRMATCMVTLRRAEVDQILLTLPFAAEPIVQFLKLGTATAFRREFREPSPCAQAFAKSSDESS
jgi:hypothetical protein